MNEKSLNTRRSGIWMMALSALLFATGGIVLKFIDWNPLAINGARSLFGALVLGIFIWVTHHKITINKPVILGAFAYVMMTTLFVVSNKLTTAGNAIILQYTCPVWIVIINALFFHKKPNRLEISTMVLAAIGICCFFYSSLSQGDWLGNVAALCSGLFYAILFMINSMKGGDALSAVFVGQIVSFVLMGWTSLSEAWTPVSFVAIFWLGAFQVGFAYLFFSLATERIPALEASLITAFEPVLNPLLVAIFWHETLSWISLIGAAIVIGAVLFYSICSAQKNRMG